MIKRLKFRRNLHRVAIILFCLTLLIVLMQGVAYFSLNNQAAQAKRSQELTRSLAEQIAFTLAPLLDGTIDAADEQQIKAILQHLTQHSRILDASVYKVDGTLIAQEGDQSSLRERLATAERQQIVETIKSKEGPVGFIRLTANTQPSKAESQQVKHTVNMLRLMLLLATVIGLIVAYTLLAHRPTANNGKLKNIIDAAQRPEPIKTAKKKQPHKKKPYR
ncbi:AhpA/YtjB family protein [Budvicia diplopodorum]|uniref:AhpA/YtjB family protein n=1 Tax=Budvicia diplopodorum TaxID=1119056 RepID=UPI0013576AE2|nr:AhpA/YtjB family protein [Budvicia diplopodorum]